MRPFNEGVFVKKTKDVEGGKKRDHRRTVLRNVTIMFVRKWIGSKWGMREFFKRRALPRLSKVGK